jgi:hypothetical protein
MNYFPLQSKIGKFFTVHKLVFIKKKKSENNFYQQSFT